MARDDAARAAAIMSAGLGLLALNRSPTTGIPGVATGTFPANPVFTGPPNLALLTPNSAGGGVASLRAILVPDLKGIIGAQFLVLATPTGAPGSIALRTLTLGDVPVPIQVVALGGAADGPIVSSASPYTGGQRYLLNQHPVAGGKFLRVYFDQTIGWETTYNCFWDNGTSLWAKDVNGDEATRNSLGSNHFSFKLGGDDVPWSDTSFSRDTFINAGQNLQCRSDPGQNQAIVHFVVYQENALPGNILRAVVPFQNEYLSTLGNQPAVTLNNSFGSLNVDRSSTTFVEITGTGCMVEVTCNFAGTAFFHGDCLITAV